MKIACEECRFWLKNEPDIGNCKKLPPTPNFDFSGPISLWPRTRSRDWCYSGEYKESE